MNLDDLRQRGFSLVEAMVGLGIAGGIGLIVMQQQESSSKMQSKINSNQVVNSVANVVQTAISNRAICSYSLAGKGVGDSIPTLFDAEVSPTNIDSFVVVGPNLVETGQILPGNVQVKEMKIVSETGKDYLSVVFDMNPDKKKKMYGGQEVGRKFQIQGVKHPVTGKFVTCHSQMSNAITTSRQLACADVGGNWNGTKCVLSTVAIYNDTLAGVLVASPRKMLQVETKGCSQCKSGCNPCPAGWTQGAGGCSLGSQCKIVHKWRNCTFECIKDHGMTPKYGELMINIP